MTATGGPKGPLPLSHQLAGLGPASWCDGLHVFNRCYENATGWLYDFDSGLLPVTH